MQSDTGILKLKEVMWTSAECRGKPARTDKGFQINDRNDHSSDPRSAPFHHVLYKSSSINIDGCSEDTIIGPFGNCFRLRVGKRAEMDRIKGQLSASR